MNPTIKVTSDDTMQQFPLTFSLFPYVKVTTLVQEISKATIMR
mgnify:CR=1 FL=1